METLTKQLTAPKGGAFIIENNLRDIFISNEFTEEQLMMAESVKEFVEKEIVPVADKLEKQEDPQLLVQLLEKAGELGFLGMGVPEEYGGFEVPFNLTLLLVEQIVKGNEFATTFGVQTSIGIAPILLYGNEEQKSTYLPKLVTGEWKCCYCLTEPGAGSDANSGKTKASIDEENNGFIINGQKMWITNAGIANIFIVFAKVEDDKNLSAFIVEKDFGGITLGDEEKKMGIKGSSTRQVFLNDVKVPGKNMLGERGQGFKIAVNVLNTGRIKLGVGATGVGKKAIDLAIDYANQRKQFGTSISEFGAIKHKIAQMATKIYVLEAAGYRTGHYIDLKNEELLANGIDPTKAKSASIAEYGIECAIMKVMGSEIQDYIVDEGVQIFGGMGFSEEAPMARMYRDSRIARIFEGTNEINRMLIVDMLLKKAMNGSLDLMTAAMEVQKDITSVPSFSSDFNEELFSKERKVLENLKKATLMVAGAAAQKLMLQLKDEQEVLMNVADMLIQVYALESALVKTEKLVSLIGEEKNKAQINMLNIYMHDAIDIINKNAKEALYAFAEGDEQKMMLMALKRYTKVEPFNLKEARRFVAETVIKENKYIF